MPLPYSIREGLAGFRRAKFASLASTSAMVVALVLIGLFGVLGYQGQQVSDWLRQRVGELEIFLDEAASASTSETLDMRAGAMPGVAQTEYISKKKAQAIFEREFGEEAELFFDDPFLPASIRVQVEPAYANPDSLNQLIDEFTSWNRVDEVVFNQPLLVKVQQNLRLFNIIGLSIGALVIVASLFLVANTIRLTIYARRLLIRTMKLVGATDPFIRRPFLIEGLLQGGLAGLIASGLVWGAYYLLASYVTLLAMPAWEMGAALAGIFVAGLLLGWIGSFMAVRRFIKNVALH